ncbi:hypothetical protein ACOMHN_007443 [Nucella lapillus]
MFVPEAILHLSLNVMSLLSSSDLSKYVNLIVDQVGSDATEQQCETACLDVMANDLLDTSCPFICTSFQTLVHIFHFGSQPATGPAKRFILDNVMSLLSSSDLSKYVNLIVDQVGSDATEQQCETACLDVMANDLLDTSCPFICTSFQTLVHIFHFGSQPATGPAKRFILDNVMSLLSSSDLSKYVNLIVDQVGSDATEQQCETACLDVMANDLLDTSCPFICSSEKHCVVKGEQQDGQKKTWYVHTEWDKQDRDSQGR